MGFRGEALASIAAISQLEMKTKPAERELGTELLVDASEIKAQEPVACEKGTNISVKNLFYNIPARRNFLKSNPVEMKHIMDEFQRIALAYPEKYFSLHHADQLVYDLHPGKLSQRIVAMFGKSYQQQLAACTEETTLVRINGYIGRPESAKKTRGDQFIFVNQRFIRSNYLNHAVTSAFEGLLPENSYPFYVLFIEIEPQHIDVNVHPTKTEIKFDDERAVYAVVRSAVKQALGAHSLAPAINFNEDVNIINKLSQGGPLSGDHYFEERYGNSLNRANLDNWEKLFEQEMTKGDLDSPSHTMLRFESAVNKGEKEQSEAEERTVFQLHRKYLVRGIQSGLMVIDQQAAHERVLYEKYLLQLKGVPGNSQQSLFPQTIELSQADFELVMEMEDEIKLLGFRFEVFGKSALLVSGVPAGVAGKEKALFEGLLDQFKINQSKLTIPVKENLARALAKRASIKSGQKLLREEMDSLVEGLFACPSPNFTPDGHPTFFIFATSKIENCFNR
jgi:DNA mismatch repair protein MutL